LGAIGSLPARRHCLIQFGEPDRPSRYRRCLIGDGLSLRNRKPSSLRPCLIFAGDLFVRDLLAGVHIGKQRVAAFRREGFQSYFGLMILGARVRKGGNRSGQRFARLFC